MIRPAFSSTARAALFLLLTLAVLASPMLVGKKYLPPREAGYGTTAPNLGNYPFNSRQIFNEKSDIDIAFVGSSLMWSDIDTPYVQQELSAKLGRKATVITLGWNWPGFDTVYFVTKDLLEHRKVHTLVINESVLKRPLPHLAAEHWFRFGDNWEDLNGLSWSSKIPFYAECVRGMPRNLWSLTRPNLDWNWLETGKDGEAYSNDRMGSLPEKVIFTESDNGTAPVFADFSPATNIPATNVIVYSSETRDRFEFAEGETMEDTFFFLKKIVSLAKKNNVRLIWLHLPRFYEKRNLKIPEMANWPKLLHDDMTMIGVAPADLMAGISEPDSYRLFKNATHMNKNGQEYFTKAITPTLIDVSTR